MPAGSTYDSIYSTTLSSNQNRIDFSSIPQTFTDLVLVIHAKATAANDIELRLNDDAAASYHRTLMWHTTAGPSISRGVNINFMRLSNYAYADTAEPASHIVHFFNYADTLYSKSVMNLGFSTNGIDHENHLWKSTSAINTITQIDIYSGNANFSTNCKFTLYGIKAA